MFKTSEKKKKLTIWNTDLRCKENTNIVVFFSWDKTLFFRAAGGNKTYFH